MCIRDSSKVYAKFGVEIYVAAKQGEPDPESNSALKFVLDLSCLLYTSINRLTGSIFGVTSDILADKAATVHTIFGQSIKVSDYFISVMEAPALNMGVFVGIISGFIGATAFNKYYNFRKLPEACLLYTSRSV